MNFAHFAQSCMSASWTSQLGAKLEALSTKRPHLASFADGAVIGSIVGTIIHTASTVVETIVDVVA